MATCDAACGKKWILGPERMIFLALPKHKLQLEEIREHANRECHSPCVLKILLVRYSLVSFA